MDFGPPVLSMDHWTNGPLTKQNITLTTIDKKISVPKIIRIHKTHVHKLILKFKNF